MDEPVSQTAKGNTRITRATDRADEGVARCAELMTGGEWITGESHKLVAEEFDVSVRTVETWASTASRAIRVAMGDGEEIRARLALLLESYAKKAMDRVGVTMGGDTYPNPDVKAATGAVKTLAELLGLMVQKHEHAVVVAQYEQLPRAGKAQWLRDKAAALLTEAERLEAER
jgi:hypothetical protein